MEMHIDAITDAFEKVFFRVSVTGEDGRAVVKTVGYEALKKMLDNSYREEEEMFPIGELPSGYLDARVYKDGCGEIRLYVPAQKHYMRFDCDEPMPVGYWIPMPAMVFQISVSSSGASHGSVYMVKGSYEEVKKAYYAGKLEVYTYPFGNVNVFGDICMGNIKLKMKGISEASKFVDAFFDGITGRDYIGSGSKVKNGMAQMELASFLSKQETFPEDILLKNEGTYLSVPYGKQKE